MYKNPVLNLLVDDNGFVIPEKLHAIIPDIFNDSGAEMDSVGFLILSSMNLDEDFVDKHIARFEPSDIFKYNRPSETVFKAMCTMTMTLDDDDITTHDNVQFLPNAVLDQWFDEESTDLLQQIIEKNYSEAAMELFTTSFLTVYKEMCEFEQLDTGDMKRLLFYIYDIIEEKSFSRDFILNEVDNERLCIIKAAMVSDTITIDDILNRKDTFTTKEILNEYETITNLEDILQVTKLGDGGFKLTKNKKLLAELLMINTLNTGQSIHELKK